jgi:flagellar biosynthesis/type III secretory pathway ATPase
VEGRNPKLDQTIRMQPAINAFLRQEPDVHLSISETMEQMECLAAQLPEL